MSRIIPGLTVLTFLAFSITAFGQDLKSAAAAEKLALEKLTYQVQDAIDASRKTARTDPRQAKSDLQLMQDRVKNTTDVSITERNRLTRQLQSRINAIDDARGSTKGNQSPRDMYSDTPRYSRPAPDPSKGASGVAQSFQGGVKGALQTQNDINRQKSEGLLKVANALEKPVLTTKDIAFPKYWKELTESRKKLVDPQLTKLEQKVLKALNSTITVEYDNEKFKSVISHLQEKTGLTIIMDQASLQEANVDYDGDTVSFPKIGKVSVRTVLKKILGDKGLTYIIKEGTIQVMTPKKASEYTVTRTYQVDDLVQGSPLTQMQFGPFVAALQRQQNAQQLANLIMSTIEPSYWQPNGPGSVQYFDVTRSLVIRASSEIHYQMSSPGLFGGR